MTTYELLTTLIMSGKIESIRNIVYGNDNHEAVAISNFIDSRARWCKVSLIEQLEKLQGSK